MNKKRVKDNNSKIRLKRRIRRTIGALLLISAIIVAAIPPENLGAEPLKDPLGTENPKYLTQAAPNYSSDSATVLGDTGKYKDLNTINSITGQATDPKTYTVIEIAGNWQLDWQFQYQKRNSGDIQGVITKYNGEYAVEEINVSYYHRGEYCFVTQEDFENFYNTNSSSSSDFTFDNPLKTGINETVIPKAKAGGEPVVLDSPTDSADRWFFEKYFPNEVLEYDAQYVHDNSLTLSKTPSTDLEPNKKLSYFCESVIGRGENFVLQKVYNLKEDPDVSGYIPRKADEDNPITAGYYLDNNKFLCGDQILINAVGPMAFKDKQNVKSLIFEPQIAYVGDSAFENSFVSSVKFNNIAQIGNRAFKNCTRLQNIEFSDKVDTVGVQAFYGCTQLGGAINFPSNVHTIGEGAFAECTALQGISSTIAVSEGVNIGDYAFYNCFSLGNVNFGNSRCKNIGIAAFGTSGGSDVLSDFKFPIGMGAGSMKDQILQNRPSLRTVTISPDFGRGINVAEVPSNTFYNCSGLEKVIFPVDGSHSCGKATYANHMFERVSNPNFYVKGPKLNGIGTDASPRIATWDAYFLNDNEKFVPYVYDENGKEVYEVKRGDFLFAVDNTGNLVSCTSTGGNSPLSVPAVVGNTPVKSIASGCFPKETLDKITAFKMEEPSVIAQIDDGVFEGAPLMTSVELADSVNRIGNNAFKNCKQITRLDIGKNIAEIGSSAFEGCNKLERIVFDIPDSLGSFTKDKIGPNAFSTGSPALTIVGGIDPVYGPYDWAMEPDNYVNPVTGVRVRYMSPAPSALTVILDNQNNLPTLVDYPHYGDIDSAIKLRYEDGDPNTVVSPADERLILATKNIVVPSGIESIDAYGYFNDKSKRIASITPMSNSASVNAYFGLGKTREVPVRASTDEELASGSPAYVMTPNSLYPGHTPGNARALYGGTVPTLSTLDTPQSGLFRGQFGNDQVGSGGTREYQPGDPLEVRDYGNDRVESITLNSVAYLPDEAFRSCENLQILNLGTAMDDVGKLPVLGATSLSTIVSGNNKYTYSNGLLFENDGNNKRLVQSVPGRGRTTGSSTVSVGNDPDLAKIIEVAEGAFRDNTNITSVDLTGVDNLTEIPKRTFDGCELLTEVDLPSNVRGIGDGAFANTGGYTQVIVRGKEVSLGARVFENVAQPYLVSYKDSAVRNAARAQGVNTERVLDYTYNVKFYNHDGTVLLKNEVVVKGKDANPPRTEDIPKRTGYKFVGWSGKYTQIDKDTTLVALYETDTTSPSTSPKPSPGTTTPTPGNTQKPGTTNNPNSGNTTNNTLYTLSVKGGTGSGSYVAGAKVTIKANEPASGDKFATWKATSNDLKIEAATSATTTVTMPAKDVGVEAEYTIGGKYKLTVDYGTGGGNYAENSTVVIEAIAAPPGKIFDKWVSTNDKLAIKAPTSYATTITMPKADTTVTATYKNADGSVATPNQPTTTSPATNQGGAIRVSSNNDSPNSRIIVDKEGISDARTAGVSVTGSADSYIVKVTDSAEAAVAMQKALASEYNNMDQIKYAAMDISLYTADGNTKITDPGNLKIKITLPLPDALRQYGGNNRVGAVAADGSLDKLPVKFITIDSVPCAVFEATHFSPYGIYVDAGNLVEGDIDITPKTGDGIHPKWFISIGLASIAIVLFMIRDKKSYYLARS